jgi:hypothetical protein
MEHLSVEFAPMKHFLYLEAAYYYEGSFEYTLSIATKASLIANQYVLILR